MPKYKVVEKQDVIKTLNKIVQYKSDNSENYVEYTFKRYFVEVRYDTIFHGAVLLDKNSNSIIDADLRKVLIIVE